LAYRNSFTGPTPEGRNIQFYQYTIGGFSIPDLQIQTGLTYAPDGKKWVMCGLNGKTPFLFVSSLGMMPYGEFPMLNGAPPEPYKTARFVNGKIVLLFQAKHEKPMLFIEDKGVFDLGDFTALPDTLSVSPDGLRFAIGGADLKGSKAFFGSLESPDKLTEVLKSGYELQNIGRGTFVWKGNHDVQFLVTRNVDLFKVSATQ
jgi:hypothetical protein